MCRRRPAPFAAVEIGVLRRPDPSALARGTGAAVLRSLTAHVARCVARCTVQAVTLKLEDAPNEHKLAQYASVTLRVLVGYLEHPTVEEACAEPSAARAAHLAQTACNT